MLYATFAIPAAFLVLLVVLVLRQRKADRVFRAATAAVDEEIERNFMSLKTAAALVADPTFVPDGELVEVGPGYAVTKRSGSEAATTFVGHQPAEPSVS